MAIDSAYLRMYEEKGFTVLRSIIPRDEVARLRQRLIEVAQGNHHWPAHHFQVLDPNQHRDPEGRAVPIGVQLPADQEPIFQRMANHPRLQKAMATFLGGAVKRYTDQALIKWPQVEGRTFYHQDSFYWQLPPKVGCNAWIALDEVGENASALAFLPGTHERWELEQHEEYFDNPAFCSGETGKPFKRFRIPSYRLNGADEMLMPMEPGDVAFFTNYTWHRAEANNTRRVICAYAVAYQLKESE